MSSWGLGSSGTENRFKDLGCGIDQNYCHNRLPKVRIVAIPYIEKVAGKLSQIER